MERLNQLSRLVDERIRKIEELELLIKDKDKIIQIMNQRIRERKE
jgi:hypothetical protein